VALQVVMMMLSQRIGTTFGFYGMMFVMMTVAGASLAVDLTFFLGAAVFPICTFAATVKGQSPLAVVALVGWYVGFGFAFRYVVHSLRLAC
jgi:hypothetical protein